MTSVQEKDTDSLSSLLAMSEQLFSFLIHPKEKIGTKRYKKLTSQERITSQCYYKYGNYKSYFQMLAQYWSELAHVKTGNLMPPSYTNDSAQAWVYRRPPRFFAPPHRFQHAGSAGNILCAVSTASAEAENKAMVGESRYHCQKFKISSSYWRLSFISPASCAKHDKGLVVVYFGGFFRNYSIFQIKP